MAIYTSGLFNRSAGGGGGDWGDIQDVTIATGVITVLPGRWYRITSETGASDALTRINGLAQGERVKITPKTGHTITVTDGANLKLQASANFVMGDVADTMILVSEGSDVLHEESRASNG